MDPQKNSLPLKWQWITFQEFIPEVLYKVLKLRQEIFVVEQNCPFLDIDGLDIFSYHLLGWSAAGENPDELLAYLRVIPPGFSFQELSIGRIITAPVVRNKGLGNILLREGLRHIKTHFGDIPIRIAAQKRLKSFYERFHFKQAGPPYDEDGILHIQMLRLPLLSSAALS